MTLQELVVMYGANLYVEFDSVNEKWKVKVSFEVFDREMYGKPYAHTGMKTYRGLGKAVEGFTDFLRDKYIKVDGIEKRLKVPKTLGDFEDE